ncbi:unnamed protein product [Acanthoscelides obtectus]|uniref:Uncharacterized protein n=1 Tax=Acanthoscelides obtectus TaxID=200917 RepID=A0A9P0Q2L9_ACAOB|nr:unnamed protein product [Acanthoscelides obtectus]CAK1624685.1 hypothetical protein AOBTE_LOCUS2697 [Acanthoscelides obtectus]
MQDLVCQWKAKPLHGRYRSRIEDNAIDTKASQGWLQSGTWDVRSLSDKEKELTQEFEKAKLGILGICDTKKKGQGMIELDGGHILVYSGAPVDQRVREGVGCVIRAEYAN